MTTKPLDWMLWYEDVKENGFPEALKQASEFYKTKYGRWPNRVQLPLAWAQEAEIFQLRLEAAGKRGIELQTCQDVLTRHLKLVFDPTDLSA